MSISASFFHAQCFDVSLPTIAVPKRTNFGTSSANLQELSPGILWKPEHMARSAGLAVVRSRKCVIRFEDCWGEFVSL